jgi:hypothetical protein
MARITHVKRAQQRFKTVPVLDDAGNQKSTPVMLLRGAELGVAELVQKTTKDGRPIVRKLTIEDPDQPLPPEECDFCHEPIAVGTAYKYTAGIIRRTRHESCPTWPPFTGSI